MMAKEKTTVVFVSDRLPLIAVVTLIKTDNKGSLRSEISVRSASPVPFPDLLQVQTVWQDWIHSCVEGQHPALPEGWRVSDGCREAPTSRRPDHNH